MRDAFVSVSGLPECLFADCKLQNDILMKIFAQDDIFCPMILCIPAACWATYRLLAQMGTKKISASSFYLFFYVCNDSANAVEDIGILFFANWQFFLKFSKIYKKINFGPFFMHISLYGGNRGNTLKIASEHHLYG